MSDKSYQVVDLDTGAFMIAKPATKDFADLLAQHLNSNEKRVRFEVRNIIADIKEGRP